MQADPRQRLRSVRPLERGARRHAHLSSCDTQPCAGAQRAAPWRDSNPHLPCPTLPSARANPNLPYREAARTPGPRRGYPDPIMQTTVVRLAHNENAEGFEPVTATAGRTRQQGNCMMAGGNRTHALNQARRAWLAGQPSCKWTVCAAPRFCGPTKGGQVLCFVDTRLLTHVRSPPTTTTTMASFETGSSEGEGESEQSAPHETDSDAGSAQETASSQPSDADSAGAESSDEEESPALPDSKVCVCVFCVLCVRIASLPAALPDVEGRGRAGRPPEMEKAKTAKRGDGQAQEEGCEACAQAARAKTQKKKAPAERAKPPIVVCTPPIH